jgi:hypothetical protein
VEPVWVSVVSAVGVSLWVPVVTLSESLSTLLVAVRCSLVGAFSSSPPHPASSSARPTAPMKIGLRHLRRKMIRVIVEAMSGRPWTHGNRLIGLDPERRRVWIGGQRVHHGLTGLMLAALGAALVAHDWKDRPVWFQRGA